MFLERWLLVLRMRVRSLFEGRQIDRELDDEVRDHLDTQIAAHIAAGMSPAAARSAALRGFGGVQQQKEEMRDASGLAAMRGSLSDLRIASRMFARRPAFSLMAAATLTLGLGASTTMFAVVNGVLLQPLPFPDPDRLMQISSAPEDRQFGRLLGLSEQLFLDFETNNTSFEHVAVYSSQPGVLTDAGDPTRISFAPVTAGFFGALATPAALGRTLLPGDQRPSHNPVVISDELWRTNFGASPDAIGRLVKLDGVSREVVGIMPPGFAFPDDADAWTPFQVVVSPRFSLIRMVLGRLRPGVSADQAQAELASLAPSPAGDPNWRTLVLPLKEREVGQVRRPLAILIAAVAFVLLVTCVNVANLVLVRMAERDRELAVRVSLGAGRRRLLRQLLLESGVIAVVGVLGALVLTATALPILIAMAPASAIPRSGLVRVDGRVIAFAAALAALTTLVFGLLPAFRATRGGHRLTGGTRTATRSADWLQGSLLVAEIALSVVLLAGAGLMLKSFLRLRGIDTGFSTANVVMATVDLAGPTYRTPSAGQAFHSVALTRLAAVPGVRAVGAINWLPLGTVSLGGDVVLDGGREAPRGYRAEKPAVSAGYFEAMGIKVLAGRAFAETDRGDSEPVSVVSRTVARDLWPGENAIGQRVRLFDEAPWLTVVGVVEDVTQQELSRQRSGAVYMLYLQTQRNQNRMTYVVRSASPPAPLVPSIRAALRNIDPAIPVPSVTPLDRLVSARTAPRAFQAQLLSIFSASALLLTIVGLYGVLSYAVSQRTREFGIRIALGATTTNVVRMVVRRTAVVAGVGISIGTVGALMLTRTLEGQLFEVRPTDPSTFASVLLLLSIAALSAAALPAWRASRVDPTIALRAE